MTSNDTLGPGFSGNVSTFLPSVSLNGTMLNNDIFRPWKTRVTSVEAGIGTPNASPAFTTTYTPQQIADFLTKYFFSPASGPEGKRAFVRDSAAVAGVPSRNNVFEYGFPDAGSASSATGRANGQKREEAIFDNGASLVPFAVSPESIPRGLPGLLFDNALVDPLGSGAAPAGGLAGLIQDYLRRNASPDR
jgi:hypothetical protein